MMMLVTYDVDLTGKEGAKRLRTVAKICENYGVRVQNSVFEILIDNTQLIELKSRLERVIDEKKDSVRLYKLGNNWENKIDSMGVQARIKQGDLLVL